jgi:hypothetical protein
MFKLAATLLLLTAPVALAQGTSYRYYDRNGIFQGSGKFDGDRFVYKNNMGITQGWDKRDGAEIRHYNNMGIYKGSTKIQR